MYDISINFVLVDLQKEQAESMHQRQKWVNLFLDKTLKYLFTQVACGMHLVKESNFMFKGFSASLTI